MIGRKITWAERVRRNEKARMAFDKSETWLGSALGVIVLAGLGAAIGVSAVETVLSV